MKLLPLIDDTPRPYDHPKQKWRYVVTRGSRPSREVWARCASAARYAVSKMDYPNNAIYYAGFYRARRIKP